MPKRVYIFCSQGSNGARDLGTALREAGVPTRRVREKTSSLLKGARPGDLLINWGPPFKGAVPKGVRTLNSAAFLDKKQQLTLLWGDGVKVPKLFKEPGSGRVGRSLHHQEGNDLLRGNASDYFVEKVETSREFRVHIFGGKSIRAGMKVPRVAKPHAWIRSHRGGWKLDYGTECQAHIRQSVRDEARKAVASLGLDFGAVDVAFRSDGRTPVVWEVNTRPGLEGQTIVAYRDAIISLLKG